LEIGILVNIMQSVQVEILGLVYSIKGMEDHAYIRELAAFCDAKMRELQKGTGTADAHRVAILAALTISDELFHLRRQYRALEESAEQSTKRLLEFTEPGEEDT
jgi:cell division protein ZapA (FtsZ GTPase activity inhibitor)